MLYSKFLFLSTGFIVYTGIVLVVVVVLIFRYVPRYGKTHMVVYVGICSLMGSLTVCDFFVFGSSFIPLQKLSILVLNFFFLFIVLFVGNECESIRNCIEADIWRIKPVYLFPNMDFYSCCSRMLSFADQLLKQGIYHNFKFSLLQIQSVCQISILF